MDTGPLFLPREMMRTISRALRRLVFLAGLLLLGIGAIGVIDWLRSASYAASGLSPQPQSANLRRIDAPYNIPGGEAIFSNYLLIIL